MTSFNLPNISIHSFIQCLLKTYYVLGIAGGKDMEDQSRPVPPTPLPQATVIGPQVMAAQRKERPGWGRNQDGVVREALWGRNTQTDPVR